MDYAYGTGRVTGHGRRWTVNLDHPEWLLAECRQAYRRIAQSIHPDHGGSGDVMRRVNEAWAWLQRRLSASSF